VKDKIEAMPIPVSITKLVIHLSGLLALSISGKAQLKWQDVTAWFGQMPPSVKVFMSTDSIEGKPNRCFYLSADLKDKNLEFTTQTGMGKRYTPDQYFLQHDSPLVVVNGTFFSFTDNRNLNLVIKNGKLTAYNITSIKGKNDSLFTYVTRSALGITKRRKADVAWLYTDSTRPYALAFENGPVHNLKGKTADPGWNFMKKKALETNSLRGYRWKMQSAIGGGPVLLHKGKVRITNSEEQMFVTDLNDKHPRTAMGYTADSRLIILLTEGRIPGKAEGMTLLQQATVLQQLGCVEALNLDGGGSSCMLVNGKQTITPSDKEGQRAVPAVFMIYAKRP
jgi:hypothetical protein